MPLGLNFRRTHRYNVSAKDLSVIPIFTLDCSCIEYTISSSTLGKDALEFVAQRLDLEETCYFGFKYESKEIDKIKWLLLNKPIKKQLDKDSSSAALFFGIMLFIDNPQFLPDSRIRKQFYLQFRSDISNGRVDLNYKAAIKLSAYSLQAEYGNFIDVESTIGNWRESPPVSSLILAEAEDLSTTQHSDDIIWGYCQLKGVSTESAIWYYLEEIKNVPSDDGLQMCISISKNGIDSRTIVFNNQRTRFFRWQDIKDLTYSKKSFCIVGVKDSGPIQINFKASDTARYLWNFSVQIHNSYLTYWKKARLLTGKKSSSPINTNPLTNLQGQLTVNNPDFIETVDAMGCTRVIPREILVSDDSFDVHNNAVMNRRQPLRSSHGLITLGHDDLEFTIPAKSLPHNNNEEEFIGIRGENQEYSLKKMINSKESEIVQRKIPGPCIRNEQVTFRKFTSLFNSPPLSSMRHQNAISTSSLDSDLSSSDQNAAAIGEHVKLNLPKSPSHRPISGKLKKKFYAGERITLDSDDSFTAQLHSDNAFSSNSLNNIDEKSVKRSDNQNIPRNAKAKGRALNEVQGKEGNQKNTKSSLFLGHFTPPAFRKFIKSAKKISLIFGSSTNGLNVEKGENERLSIDDPSKFDGISSPIMKRKNYDKQESCFHEQLNKNYNEQGLQMREIKTEPDLLDKPLIFLHPPSPMSSASNSQSLEWVLTSKPLRMLENLNKSPSDECLELPKKLSESETIDEITGSAVTVRPSNSNVEISSKSEGNQVVNEVITLGFPEKSPNTSISESNINKLLNMLSIQETALAHRLLSDYQLSLILSSKKDEESEDYRKPTTEISSSEKPNSEVSNASISCATTHITNDPSSLQSLISDTNNDEMFGRKIRYPEEMNGTNRNHHGHVDHQYSTLPKNIDRLKLRQKLYEHLSIYDLDRFKERALSMMSNTTTTDNDSNATFRIKRDNNNDQSDIQPDQSVQNNDSLENNSEKLFFNKIGSPDLTESSNGDQTRSREILSDRIQNIIASLTTPAANSLLKSLILEQKQEALHRHQHDQNSQTESMGQNQKFDDQSSEITSHLTTLECHDLNAISDGEYENIAVHTMNSSYEEQNPFSHDDENQGQNSKLLHDDDDANDDVNEEVDGVHPHPPDNNMPVQMVRGLKKAFSTTETNELFISDNLTSLQKGQACFSNSYQMNSDYLSFIKAQKTLIEEDKKKLSKEILSIMDEYYSARNAVINNTEEAFVHDQKKIEDTLEAPKKSSSLFYFSNHSSREDKSRNSFPATSSVIPEDQPAYPTTVRIEPRTYNVNSIKTSESSLEKTKKTLVRLDLKLASNKNP